MAFYKFFRRKNIKETRGSLKLSERVHRISLVPASALTLSSAEGCLPGFNPSLIGKYQISPIAASLRGGLGFFLEHGLAWVLANIMRYYRGHFMYYFTRILLFYIVRRKNNRGMLCHGPLRPSGFTALSSTDLTMTSLERAWKTELSGTFQKF